MSAPHYTPTGVPAQGSAGASTEIRAEFTAIEAGIEVLNEYPLAVFWADVNAALDQIYLCPPWACTLERYYIVCHDANSTADTILTAKLGGVAVTGGQGTILSTASEGDVITVTPTALNTLAEGSPLEIETNAGGSGTLRVTITAVFKRT